MELSSLERKMSTGMYILHVLQVLVWMVRRDGEVVSDVREVKVEPCLTNDATLSWSHSKLQPGEVALLKLKAAPNSLCSLGE